MESITYGVIRQWYYEGQIVAYTIHDVNMASMSRWGDAIMSTLEEWPADNPQYLALHDLSNSGVSMAFVVLNNYHIFTPGGNAMGRQRFEHFISRRPDLKVRLALVISNELSGQITMQHLRNAKVEPLTEVNVFVDRDAALDWLAGFIED
ncbi:MAG: hypothetical protein K8L91_16640 [Anaerolineae bacterium]|nr:hypothetical protein [Anaerolineae bacterium]